MTFPPVATDPPFDPVPPELIGREVSVRVLLPLWHAARVHGLDFAQVIAGVAYDADLLKDPRQRVSWAAFVRIAANLGALLGDEKLVAAGAISMESPVFRALLIPGRLLFGVSDVYLWVFGPSGRSSEMVVCQSGVISTVAPGHLRLRVRMQPGYERSRENYLLLRGLLAGVSWALGAGHAQVTQRDLPDGASYDILVPRNRGALRTFREGANWLFAARSAGQELERAHAELHERYMELQRALEARAELEAERQRLEEQLRHAQKMDAIGRLAGGVAHDFNNMLSIILSYSELLLQDRNTDAATRQRVGEIQKAGQRAASLTRQLLAFSRQEVVQPSVLDLDQILGDMHDMLHRLVGEDVELTAVPCADLGKVKADRGHIEQVIMNLVINARDAMPKGGRLTLETANVLLDERYAAEHLGVSAGPHVMLAVSDTGVGMDKATQARIFEPFFTTKEKGKGTGLGLSTVFGIVKQTAGSIWLYSEPGRGTTIKVYLPRTDSAPAEVNRTPGRSPAAGTETILLVDDEEQVRAVTRLILEGSGYRILEAGHGTEAVRVCQQHAGEIHLLLTDVVMPQISGPELAERITELRPGIKVIYMSGYTDDAVVRHGVLSAELVLLQKPVSPQALLSKVRASLA